MSTTLTPAISLGISGSRVNQATKERATVTLSETINFAFTNGTGNGQVDLLYSNTSTLAASTADTIDLAGVLADSAFGSTLTFATVKAIIIKSTAAANKVLTFGGNSGTWETWGSAGGTVKIMPGGMLALIAPNTGYAVTADSADIVKVTNASGGSSTYDIWIFGTSA
jgi:hypothetical protein